MITNLQAIVLAAGKSTRLQSGNSKFVEYICGREMILYPTILLEELSIPTTVVVGYQREEIKSIIEKQHHDRVHFVVQEEQEGTGHAIMCARNSWSEPLILIMHGNMPLLKPAIICNLLEEHMRQKAAISVTIAHNADPRGNTYGRLVTKDGNTQIIDPTKFDDDINEHCFIDAGIYIVSKQFLEQHITQIDRDETSNEFSLTELVKIASDEKLTIATSIAHFDHIRSVNTYEELWAVEHIKRAKLIKHWMKHGVRFSAAQTVHIDTDVEIGQNSFIGCSVQLLSKTKIGKDCTVDSFSLVKNTTLGDNSTINSHCIVKNSVIGNHSEVGPFAHVYSNVHVGNHAVIGNFVEVKRSNFGSHSKAKHHAFLGDARVGDHVNIGAGTITCNYNGSTKEKTVIEDNVFIGSNNSLVAPLTIKKGAYTAAGSTITESVPEGALAIGRARQTIKLGYSFKRQKKAPVASKESYNEQVSFVAAVKTSDDL